MATFRVTLHVEAEDGSEPELPLVPVEVRRGPDGRWLMTFDVDGPSFDSAAGRLWGEAAACGLQVRAIEPDQTPCC